jgi:hypothetical protein
MPKSQVLLNGAVQARPVDGIAGTIRHTFRCFAAWAWYEFECCHVAAHRSEVGMSKRTRLFVSLALALFLAAGVATAAAAAGVSLLPQHTAATQHAASGAASGSHPTNHGSFVSKAAHNCGHGAHAVHGKCVRAVARSSAGK